MLREAGQTRQDRPLRLHFHRGPRVVRSAELEKGELVFSGCGVLYLPGERSGEDEGDGCAAPCSYLMPWNLTLKNGSDGSSPAAQQREDSAATRVQSCML